VGTTSLSYAVSDIGLLSIIQQYLKRSRDASMPLSGTVFRLQGGTCYDQPAHDIWNLCSATMKIWRATQNVEIGMDWWVIGDPRSPAILPFDRALMTSYSTLIETMHLIPIGYGFWVMVSYLSKVTYFNPSHLHLSPPLWVTLFKFCQDLSHHKIE